MKQIPQDVSESVRRRNPDLYPPLGSLPIDKGIMKLLDKNPPKRIRQSTKPLLNKLEQEWFDFLSMKKIGLKKIGHLHTHITFRIANGLRFTPDVFCFWWPDGIEGRPTAWEVKGPWFTDDSNAKLKMFATQFPEVRVVLVWKDKLGQWQKQSVLP